MPEQLRVVLIHPGIEPEVTYIEHSLAAMQEVVGGYIQAVTLHAPLTLICNEDGIAMGLPPNRLIGGHRVYGTCFLVAANPPEFASLSEADADALRTAISLGPHLW